MVEHQDGEHLTLGKRGLSTGRVLWAQAFGQGVRREATCNFLAEIIDKAKHFNQLGSIYDKVHKAKDLGETSDNISTCSFAFLFVQTVDVYSVIPEFTLN